MMAAAAKPFPMTAADMAAFGWEQVDFVFVSGDAFVDHSSYGSAIIAGILKDHGYRVGMLAQPDWTEAEAFKIFGRPRLAFLVSSGNMDSMVCHYTVNRKRRHDDAYTPGGKTGRRPDRAVITYCARIREAFGKVPIILGGIEASLRRFAHYDYWQDQVRRPILVDSGADLLVYGMGEKAIVEVAEALDAGLAIRDLTYIKGTAVLLDQAPDDGIEIPPFEAVSTDKKTFAKAAAVIYACNDPFVEVPHYQRCGHRVLVQNPPQMPLTEMEMDDVYDRSYTGRQWSPGPEVTSLGEVRFSITANRGCFGSCAFCAIGMHQGRIVQRRSADSILKEARMMTKLPAFKGYIHDVGGPTANFYGPACEKQRQSGACRHRECLYPEVCPNIHADEGEYCRLLKQMREIPGVKKVFVRSGIRYDFLMADRKSDLFQEIVAHHISGQLRVAPEHLSDRVLSHMLKPSFSVYRAFTEQFEKINARSGKKQYLVPYFISSHPGTTLTDAVALSEYLRDHHLEPEQVQDFYPTPGSLSTAMYYTGYDPLTMEAVHVPKGREKKLQRALLQFRNPRNYPWVKEALIACGRTDLIGRGQHALIAPVPPERARTNQSKHQKQNERISNRRDQDHIRQKRSRRKETRGKRYGLQTRNKRKK